MRADVQGPGPSIARIDVDGSLDSFQFTEGG
jgi:hypothetical protein